jgi:hypothetical protein
MTVKPLRDLICVEPDELADLQVGDSLVGDQAPHVADGDAESLASWSMLISSGSVSMPGTCLLSTALHLRTEAATITPPL